MPTPATADQLFDCLRKSGLVPADRLDALAADLPDADPRAVLDRCVAAGTLTPFQADRIAAGKYKGFVLGGYVVLDRLGGGGMGQVYLAEHVKMRRRVALKVLAAAGAPETVARERFLREARAAATLDHPNIARVFDLRQDRQLLYLVMEFVEGVSLHHLIQRVGRLPVAAAAHYIWQVAQGLQHAHEHGLVHRDVKPANLLVTRDGTVKVLDLGLVRIESDGCSKLTSQLDKSILGTADYVAPEQALDSSAVDIRADLYSLGASLYTLLAGHPMFPDGRAAQKLMWQQLKDPTPIRKLRPEVPDGLAAVVHRAIRKDPADRFQTPAEMADALAPFADGPAPRPDPDALPPPPPRWNGAVPTGSAATTYTVSSAAIDLPPMPMEPRPRPLAPTLDDRDGSTPRLAPIPPPPFQTPVLNPYPEPRVAAEVPTRPGLAPPPAVTAALVAVGFVAGVFCMWLAGMMAK